MKRGTKVRVKKLTSDRGIHFTSVRPEYFYRIEGIVKEGPDEVQCVIVKFDTFAGRVSLPCSILEIK